MSITQSKQNLPFTCEQTTLGLMLKSMLPGFKNSFFVDYTKGNLGYRLHSQRVLHEPLAKVIDKKAWVLDTTAGIARDSLMMALLGCKITCCEAHPLIAQLVKDALKRIDSSHYLYPIISNPQRFKFIEQDAVTLLKQFLHKAIDERPDIVYIDPMFPKKDKHSDAKKEMKWLQLIHESTPIMYPDFTSSPAEEIFSYAQKVATKKIIIKRPAHAPHLITLPLPSFSRAAQSTRFDVYLV